MWGIVLLTILCLGLIDYLTGPEIAFSIFYTLPVSLAAWKLGENPGYFFSFLSGLIWMAGELLVQEGLSNYFIPFWNAVARTGFFLFTTYLLTEMRRVLEHERTLARTDPLTGSLNRRTFYDLLTLELARVERHQHPLTLLYLDIDNFKTINDRYGHLAGDRLLERVAHTITRNIRVIDIVARLGGDEFALLLPETDEAAARLIAPRLRQCLLAEMEAFHWHVTFSIGVLTCHTVPPSAEKTIHLADQLMYKVKHALKDDIRYAVYPN